MAITSWGDFGRSFTEIDEEERRLREALERGSLAFQPAQTAEQMIDISTPPNQKPFALPSQMLPQPEPTVVPAGNPFLQEQFAPSVSPNPQYRPQTPVPGLLGGGIPTSQTIGSDALRTISEQMQADPSMRPENLNFPTPQFNPSRPDVSMSNRGDVGQDRSQTPNSVFGNDIGSSLADAMSAVANKIGQKRFNQPSPSMSVDQSRGATIGIQDQLGVEQSIADSLNSQQAQDEAARRAQALRQQTPTGDGSALTDIESGTKRVDADVNIAAERDDNAEGERIVAEAVGKEGAGGFNLVNTLVPAGGSELFGKREVAEKFTEQVKKKEAESPGFVKRMLSNPNLFPYLAMAFNTMRLNPDASLNAAMMKTIESNNELRKANRTAAWFMSQGTPEGKKAAEFIAAGGSAKDAMEMFMPRYSMNTRVVVDKAGNRKLLTVSDKGIPKLIDLPEGFSPQEEFKYIDAGTYTSIVDAKTAVEIGRIPKNVSQAAQEQATGKAEGEFTTQQKLKAPQSFEVAQNMVKVIGDFLNHPGFESVFGAIQGRLPTVLPEATDAERYLKQIQGQAFLRAFETLKGGGQITEREGIAATQAISRLNSAQSEAAAEEALFELYDIAIKAMKKAKDANPEALKDFVIPELPQRRYSGVGLDGESVRIDEEIIDAKDLF